MAQKKESRRFRDVEAEYFCNRPDEIMPYLAEIFEEYAKDDI